MQTATAYEKLNASQQAESAQLQHNLDGNYSGVFCGQQLPP